MRIATGLFASACLGLALTAPARGQEPAKAVPPKVDAPRPKPEALPPTLNPLPTKPKESPRPEAPKAKPKESREMVLRRLKKEVEFNRFRLASKEAELKRQIQDPRALQDAEKKKTDALMKVYFDAKMKREISEIDRKEYEGGTFLQELETIQGEIALDESDVERATDRLGHDPSLMNRLLMQKATFALEQSRTRLKVLTEFTKAYEIKKLDAKVAEAKAKEAECQADYERQKALEKVAVDELMQLARFDPYLQMLILYKQADDLQLKINALLREVSDLTRKPAGTPEDGEKRLAEIRKKRGEIGELERQIRVKLSTAISMSELLRQTRDEVATARDELTKAERTLDTLEAERP